MPSYRLYSLNARGHVTLPATIIEAEDGAAAIAKAKELQDDRDIEIWCVMNQAAPLRGEPYCPEPEIRDIRMPGLEYCIGRSARWKRGCCRRTWSI
jgi:hypothetical protein